MGYKNQNLKYYHTRGGLGMVAIGVGGAASLSYNAIGSPVINLKGNLFFLLLRKYFGHMYGENAGK
jgi:hypothetical protein